FGRSAAGRLLADASGIDAHVGTAPALGVSAPVPLLAVAQGVAVVQQFAQAPTSVLGGALDGRFAQTQANRLGQDLGGLLEAVAEQAEQGDDALGARGQAVLGQAGLVIEGAKAQATAATAVVGAAEADGAQQARRLKGAVAVEGRCLLALRASHPGPPVTVFF